MSKMKAINSEDRPLVGVDKRVELEVGQWRGTTNLMAALIDNFKVIHVMEFHGLAKAVPIPYLGIVSIME